MVAVSVGVVVILSVVTEAALMLLWLARSSTAPSLVAGIGIATLILSHLPIEGFAPDGCFPTLWLRCSPRLPLGWSAFPRPPRDRTLSAEANMRHDLCRTTDADSDATTAP